MKKLLIFITTLSLFLICPISTSANTLYTTENNTLQIEHLDNGDYIETTFQSLPSPTYALFASTKTTQQISKTKKITYKNKAGNIIWYISITGTFTYNGSSAKCISCSHNAKSYGKSWTIKSVSSSKSGNSATATAVIKQSGNISRTYNEQVTITCSKNGTIS